MDLFDLLEPLTQAEMIEEALAALEEAVALADKNPDDREGLLEGGVAEAIDALDRAAVEPSLELLAALANDKLGAPAALGDDNVRSADGIREEAIRILSDEVNPVTMTVPAAIALLKSPRLSPLAEFQVAMFGQGPFVDHEGDEVDVRAAVRSAVSEIGGLRAEMAHPGTTPERMGEIHHQIAEELFDLGRMLRHVGFESDY